MKDRVFAMAALASLLVVGSAALAHDVIKQSNPSANSTVGPGRVPISVSYSGKVDRARSQLVLAAPDGTKRELEVDESAPANVLRTATPVELGPGTYVLRWLVLYADGHITRGGIPFRVAPAS
jgi:methionine-rich copper-binding protein CopC